MWSSFAEYLIRVSSSYRANPRPESPRGCDGRPFPQSVDSRLHLRGPSIHRAATRRHERGARSAFHRPRPGDARRRRRGRRCAPCRRRHRRPAGPRGRRPRSPSKETPLISLTATSCAPAPDNTIRIKTVDGETAVRCAAPMDDQTWALAYLRGRLKSYRRGNLSENNVRGAIRAALELSVPIDKVRALLVEYAPELDVNLTAP